MGRINEGFFPRVALNQDWKGMGERSSGRPPQVGGICSLCFCQSHFLSSTKFYSLTRFNHHGRIIIFENPTDHFSDIIEDLIF